MRKTLLTLFAATTTWLTACNITPKQNPTVYGVDSVAIKNDTLAVYATQQRVQNAKQDTFLYRYADQGRDLRYTNARFHTEDFVSSYNKEQRFIDTLKPVELRSFSIIDRRKDREFETTFMLDRFALNKEDMKVLGAKIDYMPGGRSGGHYHYQKMVEVLKN